MSEIREIASRWWGAALGDFAAEDRLTGAQRALRARLRRADGPVEALAEQRVVELTRDLRMEHRAAEAAALAQVLANVKKRDRQSLAAAFGRPKGEGRALSDLRFQRLVRERDPVALAPLLIRALPLADNACDVGRLAEDFVFWSDDTRTRWCFQYFGAPPPAPSDQPNANDTDNAAEADA